MVLEPMYLAQIADVDRGLSEILSKFCAGAPVCLVIRSPVAGSLWWFWVFGSLPVVLVSETAPVVWEHPVSGWDRRSESWT